MCTRTASIGFSAFEILNSNKTYGDFLVRFSLYRSRIAALSIHHSYH